MAVPSRPHRYVRHLTLLTGDQRDSYRAEVADEVVTLLQPILDRAVAGERVTVPGQPGYTLTATRGRDRALLVTVWGGSIVPLVTMGIAPSSLASATLWREWRGRERDDMTPRPPWCVVEIHPTVAIYADWVGWLGDLERCIAWAWIER